MTICATNEVYMTLWNGKPEKVTILTLLEDSVPLLTKRIEVVSAGLASDVPSKP